MRGGLPQVGTAADSSFRSAIRGVQDMVWPGMVERCRRQSCVTCTSSDWPVERIEVGDWSAAALRSPELAKAAARIANDEKLLPIVDQKIGPSAVLHGGARTVAKSSAGTPGCLSALWYRGAEAQGRIKAAPDTYMVFTKQTKAEGPFGGRKDNDTENLPQNVGLLLVAVPARFRD